MKTTVIYHSADLDGIFCREIARKFLPEDTEFIGWNHGDDKIIFPEGRVYVLDLSPECFDDSTNEYLCYPRLIWIDHHKSSMEKFSGDIPGWRIDGVAACRLAWQWFSIMEHNAQNQTNEQLQLPLPHKIAFTERNVSEPWAVRLAGEYDIWDRRDPDAELFQHGLRSRDLTNDWRLMLSYDSKSTIEEIEALVSVGHRGLLNPDGTQPNPTVCSLLESGKVLQYYQTRQNESIIKEMGFTLEWEGLKFLACNHARYNSHLFTAGLTPEHDACYGFKWTGKKWSISLYHAPGKEHIDLSLIATKYGGGGHRGACGFQTDKLPFIV